MGTAQDKETDFLSLQLSLKVEGKTLDQVLEQISKIVGINFSYDPTLIDTDLPVTASYTDKSLQFMLSDLLGSEFTYGQLGNQLIIRLQQPVSSDDLVQDGYRIITGQIIDREYDDPIPYASISIFEEAFGTITNTDGWFELKIPPKYSDEKLVVSCLGYQREVLDPDSLIDEALIIALNPINIRLREIKVRALNPLWVLEQLIDHIPDNYSNESSLMTAFYREVLSQDGVFVNVSEAVLQLLKAPYNLPFRDDQIRYLKGRKSPDVETFDWVDFKMQGGPYYTALLDVVKNRDSFLSEDFRVGYKYEAGNMVDYLGRPTYVITFAPVGKSDVLTYEGELYIDQESFALVHAEFNLSKNGIRLARQQLIRKKPKGFIVRALNLEYKISYQKTGELWYLSTAQASASFRVRSRRDQVNAVFHSVSDMLITSHEPTRLRRFQKEEQFRSSDIFIDLISDYDPDFWGNYNIIRPTDDLREAIRSLVDENENVQTN